MKFGDVIVTVASLVVVFILVDSVLGLALVPMNSAWGLDVDLVVSF